MKIIKILIGLLVLNAISCTQEKKANYVQHLNNELEPPIIERAEDSIAMEDGKLQIDGTQIDGTQIKYYSETETFNVWPIDDPKNAAIRRANTGPGPIADFLRMRYDIDWDPETQLKRREEFKSDNEIEAKDPDTSQARCTPSFQNHLLRFTLNH